MRVPGRDFMILFVALGAVGAAGEFRHGTAIPTFPATPVRGRGEACRLPGARPARGAGRDSAAARDRTPVARRGWPRDRPLERGPHQPGDVADGWFTIAESALAILAPGISRFLPGGAFSAVDTHDLQLLPRYAAIPLLAAYVTTVSLLALRATLRRDIT